MNRIEIKSRIHDYSVTFIKDLEGKIKEFAKDCVYIIDKNGKADGLFAGYLEETHEYYRD